MKNLFVLIKACALCTCLFVIGCKDGKSEYQEKDPITLLEDLYVSKLDSASSDLYKLRNTENLADKKDYFLNARRNFKNVEVILAYQDASNYKSLNGPNILKVDEEDATNIKIMEPFGFQVIEEHLFSEEIDHEKLNDLVQKTAQRLRLISNNSRLRLEEHNVFWMLRDEIVRISTLGITGFDSPVLEQSLAEAQFSYDGIQKILELFLKEPELKAAWDEELKQTKIALETDFEAFDRYQFIKDRTHQQLELLLSTAKIWQVEFPLEFAIANDATNLFSEDSFNLAYFSDYDEKMKYSEEKRELGKLLFEDKKLSDSKTMSCATCHEAKWAFTDGLKRFEGQLRNTPTLTYAGLQKAFFYDNRSNSLEGQIVSVVENEKEFHSDLEKFTVAVKNGSVYQQSFERLYENGITDANIRNALASYIRSLMPFNSKFDRNMKNMESSLSDAEINGFNLFMGKAKCATCHFAPVFNGTIPPEYRDTEMELLGVPADTTKNPKIDQDPGRFDYFETENRRHFFKTPTVRNVAMTAPYMHNGVYRTLKQVMEFYNNGGGTGLGIEQDYQTLPSDSLELSEKEMNEIIAFMESLTDEKYVKN